MKRVRGWAAVFCMMFAITNAIGGDEKGNGGAVVTCFNPDQTVQSTRLLDFYEAKVMRDIDYELGMPNVPSSGKVKYALDRLHRLDRDRAITYQERAEAFLANALFIDEVILPDTKDFGLVPIPAHCKIEQLAIQKNPVFPEDKRYWISKAIWNRLDEDQRAGLILHEIVYGEALALGQTTSVNARYFTSLVASDHFMSMNGSEYASILKLIGFSSGPMGDLSWLMQPISLPDACATYDYSVDLTRYIYNPAGEPLRFTVGGIPQWMTLQPSGLILGAPDKADIGSTSTFDIGVLSKEKGMIGTATVRVIKCSIGGNTQISAIANQALNVDLASLVGVVGHLLSFSKDSGPAWMMISSDGRIFGTPRKSDIGTNAFQVRIIDSDGTTRIFTLLVTVSQ